MIKENENQNNMNFSMFDVRKLVSDEEVERVHANANFGLMSKRDVLSRGVLQTASGFHTGNTMRNIIIEHGLAKSQKNPLKVPLLTKKGREYLWCAFYDKGESYEI